jgi:hypothetical protein
MRKPSKSKAQRAYDKEKRLLLRLRKASVMYTIAMDDDELDDHPMRVSLIERLTMLQAAANAYTNNLSPREKRKLSK